MAEAGYRVTGRVQGVGYRWWTHAQATRLGLEGWVRNCSDGSVEVALRGPVAVVERMRALLAEGPSGAAVESVQAVPLSPIAPGEFRIVR